MPEVRLIDANALKLHICNMCDDEQRECKGDESCALLVWVNDMPTIEAEPVQHGRWIDNGNDKYICSSCKGYVYRWFGKSYLCPNCHARMDEGDENG